MTRGGDGQTLASSQLGLGTVPSIPVPLDCHGTVSCRGEASGEGLWRVKMGCPGLVCNGLSTCCTHRALQRGGPRKPSRSPQPSPLSEEGSGLGRAESVGRFHRKPSPPASALPPGAGNVQKAESRPASRWGTIYVLTWACPGSRGLVTSRLVKVTAFPITTPACSQGAAELAVALAARWRPPGNCKPSCCPGHTLEPFAQGLDWDADIGGHC